MHNYETTYRTLSPGWVNQKANRSNFGWGRGQLPYLEQMPLYDRIHSNTSFADVLAEDDLQRIDADQDWFLPLPE